MRFLALLLLLFSAPVFAQGIVVQGEPGEEYDFVPVAQWHFGATGRVDGNACSFSNVFNNGFVIQLIEKNDAVKALVVDFAQETFEIGQFYPVILFVNNTPKEVRGLAVSTTALRFNLTEPIDKGVFRDYAGQSINLRSEGASFRFILTGLDEAMRSINNCDIEEKTDETLLTAEEVEKRMRKVVEEALAAQENSMQGVADNNTDTAAFEKALNEELARMSVVEYEDEQSDAPSLPVMDDEFISELEARPPQSLKPVEMVSATKSKIQPANNNENKTTSTLWVAKKGERVSDVITRWADKEGVKVEWDSDIDPELPGSIQTEEDFNGAVNVLMRLTGLSAVSESGETAENIVKAPKAVAPEKPVEELYVTEYRGLNGMDLQTVLRNWSEKAGVDLYWQTERRFNLEEEFRTEAAYAEAVQKLLNNFNSKKIKPVARLNRDPETGKLALIIKEKS